MKTNNKSKRKLTALVTAASMLLLPVFSLTACAEESSAPDKDDSYILKQAPSYEALEPWEKKLVPLGLNDTPNFEYLEAYQSAEDSHIFEAFVQINVFEPTPGNENLYDHNDYADSVYEAVSELKLSDEQIIDIDDYENALILMLSKEEVKRVAQYGFVGNISFPLGEAAETSDNSIESLNIYIDGEENPSEPRVYEYMCGAVEPEVDIYDGEKELRQDVDYTVSYSNNETIGTARLTITGIGAYRGVCKYDYEIKRYEDIFRFDIYRETPDFYDLYTDNGVNLSKPCVGSFDTMNTFDGYEFQSNDNGTIGLIGVDEGILCLKIPAAFKEGYYYDRPDVVMEIRENALKNNKTAQGVELPNTIYTIGENAFKGMEAVKRIYVPVSVKKIADGAFDELPTDFKLICVKGSYAEEYAKSNDIPYAYPEDDDFDKNVLENAQTDINTLTGLIDGLVFSFSEPELPLNYEYTGSKITPEVVIKDGEKTLTPDVDYKLYYVGNLHVGRAMIIISGIGNYKDGCVLYFNIVDHADIMPYDPVMGDLDGDNIVTANDALFALRASLEMEELTEDQIINGDIDADNVITSADAVAILRISTSR